MALAGANVYALLPDDNDGDMEEFLNKVSEKAKITAAEEKKKKRIAEEEKAKKMQEEKSEENDVVDPSMMGAKIPVIPKWWQKSQIVFRKPKPEDKYGKDQETGGCVKETEKAGDNNHTQRHNAHRRRFPSANHDGEGSYGRNCENSNLVQNNGGEQVQGVVKEEGSYKKNYKRVNLYYQDNNNNINGGGTCIPHRGGRGGGRGHGRGRREWRQSNGDLSSADNRNGHERNETRFEVSDNVEKKEPVDNAEQPINGDNGAESKEEEKKKNNNSKKKPSRVEEMEPPKTMTYQEFEKVLIEKKKALQAQVGSDQKQKASRDKDEFESMKPIGKKKEKPDSLEDNAARNDRVSSNKKKGSKSMSIDEFCGYRGGRFGGRNGRLESNYGAEFRGHGGAFSSQPPKVEDVNQFPAL